GDNALLWTGQKVDPSTGERSVRTKVGVGESFRRVTTRLGLKIRIHDLRHTFAGLYLVDGGDIFRLSRILGQASVAITEKIYAHLRPDAFKQTMRA
ncbi:MAG TPA: tyrosine-type recombinase/integrase, partial [Kofleriaceae bacterium]|nr:tyrosine-type recombinase/integrase [Kofleriaceae bacterium]